MNRCASPMRRSSQRLSLSGYLLMINLTCQQRDTHSFLICDSLLKTVDRRGAV